MYLFEPANSLKYSNFCLYVAKLVNLANLSMPLENDILMLSKPGNLEYSMNMIKKALGQVIISQTYGDIRARELKKSIM